MAAITKAFTAIADTAVDPDSPVDTALITALRDNATHLREWLGAGYYAGAIQDHNHDGVNSANVEIGPNLLRNGSFESGEAGWTFTDYSGGSHAISATEYIHGVKSLAITSTVLANGGGDAESNEYIPVGGLQFLSFEIWRWASVANISSKAEVVWYDNAKAQISVTAIYSDINTPTAKTLVQTGLQAPSTARYARLRVTGGVPGTGTATGTVYFDGGMIGRTYIVEPLIGPAAVTQSKLKTTTAEVSASIGPSARTNLALAGGLYILGWETRVSSAAEYTAEFATTPLNTAYATYVGLTNNDTGISNTVYFNHRYVQSSPPWEPYRAGDAVPVFVFALLDRATQAILETYTAEDPPWGNNGPTPINPLGRLRAFARSRLGVMPEQARSNPALRAQLDDELDALYLTLRDPKMSPVIQAEMARKFTQAEKNADMPLIPHPFGSYDPIKHVVVVLNPIDDKFCRGLNARHCVLGDSIAEALHDGHIIIDNSPMPGLVTPSSVMAVRARWKLTK